jgi:hypothetical protein
MQAGVGREESKSDQGAFGGDYAMAIVRISREWWDRVQERNLLLPHPIEATSMVHYWDNDDVLARTKIDGFGKAEFAYPVYSEDMQGNVVLVSIEHESVCST